jgi:hypothetical protein
LCIDGVPDVKNQEFHIAVSTTSLHYVFIKLIIVYDSDLRVNRFTRS